MQRFIRASSIQVHTSVVIAIYVLLNALEYYVINSHTVHGLASLTGYFIYSREHKYTSIVHIQATRTTN